MRRESAERLIILLLVRLPTNEHALVSADLLPVCACCYARLSIGANITSAVCRSKISVSMLISIPPKYAVSQMVGFIEGKSAQGDLSVTDFASVDKHLTEDPLKWKSLSLGAIDFNLQPMKVSLDEIALADFYARIILSAEGRLNLQDPVAPPSRQGPAAAPQPATPTPETAAPLIAPLVQVTAATGPVKGPVEAPAC